MFAQTTPLHRPPRSRAGHPAGRWVRYFSGHATTPPLWCLAPNALGRRQLAPQPASQLACRWPYQLHIPYADARELLMDIQRHLPEVEIHSPPELKQALLQHLRQAIQRHEKSENK